MIQESIEMGKEIEELRWEREAMDAPGSNAGYFQKAPLTKRIRALQRVFNNMLSQMGSNQYTLKNGPQAGKVVILPQEQRYYDIPIRSTQSGTVELYKYERTSCRTMVYTGKRTRVSQE